MVSNLCFLEKSLERDTGQQVRFKSLVFLFLFFLTLVGDFQLNTTFKAFQTLKTSICLDCPVTSEQNDVTYFRVLRYITSFKRAELQFSRILTGTHAKFLEDPKQMKL